jgi:hypothetical protein
MFYIEFSPFLLFDRAAGLSPAPTAGKVRPARADAVKGWPPLAATVRLGLDGIEHDGTLARSGPSLRGL